MVSMKFRMIWLGPEDDPDGHKFVSEGRADVREAGAGVLYERRGGEMVRRKPSRCGSVELIPLANFVARILKDIIYDEDIGRREFSLEAELAGQKTSFVVTAAEFSRMNWVLRELGPRAIIYPGQQQQARAAIQYLSGNIQREHMFSH